MEKMLQSTVDGDQRSTDMQIMLGPTEIDHEEVLDDSLMSLKQHDNLRKSEVAIDTIQAPHYMKRKDKQKHTVHTKKLKKSAGNKTNQKGQKIRTKESKNLDPMKAKPKNVAEDKKAKKKKHHSKKQLLPETICTHGERRKLKFTPEFLAMLRLVFQHDIQKKCIRKKKIQHILRRNPEFLRICKKMELSIENVRNRIRMMIKKE
ncbi:uncharacterized protein LOC125287603 [Alosa alosa]|uniref:uncharacterized protein LOC125287603 n=1 Tax=Alosa alosa TaxID=278164 RepID=UPI00201511C0|nr:uncharacterized protein LOC125287603 [Alosa alosa]